MPPYNIQHEARATLAGHRRSHRPRGAGMAQRRPDAARPPGLRLALRSGRCRRPRGGNTCRAVRWASRDCRGETGNHCPDRGTGRGGRRPWRHAGRSSAVSRPRPRLCRDSGGGRCCDLPVLRSAGRLPAGSSERFFGGRGSRTEPLGPGPVLDRGWCFEWAFERLRLQFGHGCEPWKTSFAIAGRREKFALQFGHGREPWKTMAAVRFGPTLWARTSAGTGAWLTWPQRQVR